MSDEKMYYAAFGIFTNERVMRRTVRNAHLVGRGTVRGWRFDWRGCADTFRDPNSDMQVVVWEIDKEGQRSLDMVEGYPSHYTRVNLTIRVDFTDEAPGRFVTGFMYTMARKGNQYAPNTDMYNTLLEGYRQHGMSIDPLAHALKRAYMNMAITRGGIHAYQ